MTDFTVHYFEWSRYMLKHVLECVTMYFRMCSQALPQGNIRVTTSTRVILPEFCAIFKSEPYALLYALSCISSEISTYLYHFKRVTIKCFFNAVHYLFLEKLQKCIVTRRKTDWGELISPKVYKKTYRNTSGNLLKIVNVKNVIKCL